LFLSANTKRLNIFPIDGIVIWSLVIETVQNLSENN